MQEKYADVNISRKPYINERTDTILPYPAIIFVPNIQLNIIFYAKSLTCISSCCLRGLGNNAFRYHLLVTHLHLSDASQNVKHFLLLHRFLQIRIGMKVRALIFQFLIDQSRHKDDRYVSTPLTFPDHP